MAVSNAKRGALIKARTRRWLAAHGWQVAEMEIIRWVWTPKGRLPIKRDQWGADLIAVSATRLALIQVKGGAQTEGQGQFLAAQREFNKFTFPSFVERWIVCWAPRARLPRVIELRRSRP